VSSWHEDKHRWRPRALADPLAQPLAAANASPAAHPLFPTSYPFAPTRTRSRRTGCAPVGWIE
jgi:hypothetical protein